MKLVKVTLKTGKVIAVLPQEVEILRKAGHLKESKVASETKEFKDEAETKEIKVTGKDTKTPERRSKGFFNPKNPANISSANIRGGRPKNVK